MGEFYASLNSRLSANCAAACGTIGPHPSEIRHAQLPPQPDRRPCGLPERLFQSETREYVRAAFAVEGFGPNYPVPAQFRQDRGILQWLIAKSPCGHPTPVLARVKGRLQGPGRSQGVNL